jgi:hypothetical protein
MAKRKPFWVPNFYRFTFAGLSLGGLALAFVHPVAAIALFTLAAMSVVASGDLPIESAIALIRWAKPEK